MRHTILALALAVSAAVSASAAAEDAPKADLAKAPIPDLVDRLASAEPAERAAAAAALGARYPDAAAAAPALLDLVDDRDAAVRGAALRAVSDLAARGLGDIATYLEALRKDPVERKAWLTLANELGSLGPALTPLDLATAASVRVPGKPSPAELSRRRALTSILASGTGRDGVNAMSEQQMELAGSLSRSADPRCRGTGLAALAVLARAELFARRCDGIPVEIPAADDAAAVARLLALLDGGAAADAAVQRAMREQVFATLGSTYGHAGDAFRQALEMDTANDAAVIAKTRLEVSGVAPDAPDAQWYVRGLGMAIPTQISKSLKGLGVRREAAVGLLPEIRGLLQSKEPSVRLAAALFVLQVRPGDAEAGPVALAEFRELALSPAVGAGARGRRSLIEVGAKWLRRMPEPPVGLCELLYPLIRGDDSDGSVAIARAMGPSLARNPQLQRVLLKWYFPDDGDPPKSFPDGAIRDAVIEQLAQAGRASAPVVREWAAALADEKDRDAVEQILSFGPAWEPTRPARVLRLVAEVGPGAAAALPAIEPYLASKDLLLRYRARVAVARIRSDR